MAIDIITGFNSASRESLDKRSGPYASLAAAKAALDTNERFVGLKVLVADGATPDSAGNFIDGDLTEYVFTGGISDNDLIDPIATAVANLVDGAPGSLDTLNEIAAALEDNADFLNSYYTKTELDHATTGKADKSDVYTKTELDHATTGKADKSDVYTKTELDTALGDKVENAGGVTTIQKLTQAQYDALTPDANTLYIITI